MERTSALTSLNVRKPKTSLSHVVRKALGQCRRLKKKVGRVIGKGKRSYEVNTRCSTFPQNTTTEETPTNDRKSPEKHAGHPTNAMARLSVTNDAKQGSSLKLTTPCDKAGGQQTEPVFSSDMTSKNKESSAEFRRSSVGIYRTDRVMWIETKGELTPTNKTPFLCGNRKTTPAPSTIDVNPEVFERLDKRALQISKLGVTSLQKLVNKLIKGCDTDVEKARVLFRWVVEKDYRQRRSGSGPPRQSYHLLYQRLCRMSGLRCEIIQGYSKGAGYKPGMDINTHSFRNCWTAVSIDGTWRLVNCTWAARHRAWNTSSSVDEFYFMTDPYHHIYQHLPDDPSWQLLGIPISRERFIELPLLKSNFFTSGLELNQVKTHMSTIVTGEQNIEIRMRIPDHIDIGSCLVPQDPDVINSEAHTTHRWENNEAVFNIHSPQYDCFFFSIYAGKIGGTLESACCFQIKFLNSPFF